MVATVSLLPSTVQSQVDPTGRWRTLQTEHFNVHVREEYRELGPRAAGEAEAAWAQLAALLPAPRSRIELVVADNTDEPNGYATTYPVPHVVIYALPPAGDLALEAYDRWLHLVITHELAHIFHLDLARGWWGAARSVLGRAPFLFPNNYTPPWMREGLAVFYESRLTGTGRLDGAFHRSIVDAQAAEAGGLRIDAANTPTPKWPGGLRAYAFGAAVMDSAAAAHGDSAIAGFVRTLARRPLPYLQIGSSWRRATGERLREDWRRVGGPFGEMENDWPPADSAARTGDVKVSRLRLTVPPRLSPDGRFLALAHNDGRDATYLMLLDRRATDSATAWTRVDRLNGVSGLAFMPDGRILTSQMEFSDPNTARADLYAMDKRGRVQRLTYRERLMEPDIAPDGAIVAIRAQPGATELVLRDASAQGGWRVVGAAERGVEWASPRFSPGGDTIVAVRVHNGWHDIRLLGRDGHTIRDLTRDSVPDLQPAFSRDGRWVLWSRDVAGVAQVVGSRDGGPVVQLTREPFAAYAPAAADSLYYLAYHADGYALVSRPLVAGDTVPVTAGDPGEYREPATLVAREKSYSIFPSVLPHYWVPQLYVQPGAAWAGALSSGADALGRHLWSASLMLGLGDLDGRVAGDAAWVYNGIRHLALDASWSQHPELYIGAAITPQGPATTGPQCCDPNGAVRLGVSVVRRRWRSQASARLGLESTSDGLVARRGASLALRYGRLVGAPLGISIQDGWSVAGSVRYRARTAGRLDATELLVRGTVYQSSGSRSFAKQVFAARLAAGLVAGSDPIEYAVGGVSSEGFQVVPGLALGGGIRNFQVRGYQPGTLTGRRALGASLENRVPLALVDRGLGMLPVGLDRLSASLFTDAALAWSAKQCPTFDPTAPGSRLCAEWIWSAGAELTADLGLGYELPLRVRAGSALRIRESGTLGAWIAIGSAF